MATLVLVTVVVVCWAAASPLFAGPDEPSHQRKAAGVVRGQLTDDIDPRTGAGIVEAPAVLDNDSACYAFDPDQPADCLDVADAGGAVDLGHTATGYPPGYYAVVGVPTLLTGGRPMLYGQRAVGGVLAAALVALAALALAELPDPRHALLGLGVALTPMVLFLASVVNPSGAAIAAAVATWAGGYQLARRAPVDRLAGLVARTAGPLCVLILVRRDTVVWAAVVVAALVAVVPPERRAALAGARPVWAGGAAVAIATVVQLWLAGVTRLSSFAEKAVLAPAPATDAGWVVDQEALLVRQMVGVLGWLDTELPAALHWLVVALVASLVITAVRHGPRRVAVVALVLVVGLAVTWLALAFVRPGYSHGRYLLPVAVGVPLLAAAGAAEGGRRPVSPTARVWPPVASAVALGLVWAVEVVAFWTNLRRYAVGASGPWWFPGSEAWVPPLVPSLVLVAVDAVAMAALVGTWWRSSPPAPGAPAPHDVDLAPGTAQPPPSQPSASAASAPTVVDSP